MSIAFGEGAGPDFVRWMGDRYIDLAQELTKAQPPRLYNPSLVYTDFEGLTSLADLQDYFEPHFEPQLNERLRNGPDFVRDLLVHWLSEQVDQCGHRPTLDECYAFIDTLQWLFSSRFWLKADA